MIAIDKQIAALEQAKRLIDECCYTGLCGAIRESLFNTGNSEVYGTASNYVDPKALTDYIPLFTRENAVKYAHASLHSGLFWWDTTIGDIPKRIFFCNWMIKQLQDGNNQL